MQIPKLKVLVEAGAVREIEAMPDGDGWAVWIVHATHNGNRREALERQRGGARVFATLDAVAGAPLTLQRMLGWLCAPLAWSLGLPWAEATLGGALLGAKTVLISARSAS